MNEDPIKKRRGANLPHWERSGATYSITYRLADSLPKSAVERLASERRMLERQLAPDRTQLTPEERERLNVLCSERVDALLANCHGACPLRNDAAASVVADNLNHFDGKRYDLLAWCVMPNHVHVMATPYEGWPLDKLLHSWKQFTAKKVNALLGRTGTFWQSEYYDHLVRGAADLAHCVKYILENPIKAGLKNWKWVGWKPGLFGVESGMG